MASNQDPRPTPPPRRVPPGKPLDWSDAELDALAEVSPHDVEEARQWWKRHAPEGFKELLDADPADDAPAP